MKRTNPMTPAEIIQALDDVEISQAGLARDINVNRTMIHLVIYDKSGSPRVREHIAKAINRPVDEIWAPRQNPPKLGRPLTKGLYYRPPHYKD